MLKNKVVIVTGGCGLLGKEFIRAILMQGGIAVMADINSAVGEKTKEQLTIELQDSNIDYVNLDITSKKSIQNAIETIDAKYGKIDALVNNAYPRNKNYGRDFFDIEYEDFNQNMNMHLGGYFLTAQIVSKYFLEQGFGNIINMSSIYGVIAPRFEVYSDVDFTMPVEYAAIKSSIIHLTKYMAKYFKGANIRVNAISPGGISDHQPESFTNLYKKYCNSKGMLDPNDMSGTLIYLLSDMSQYINGQNIIVDDGFTL